MRCPVTLDHDDIAVGVHDSDASAVPATVHREAEVLVGLAEREAEEHAGDEVEQRRLACLVLAEQHRQPRAEIAQLEAREGAEPVDR